MSENIPGLKNLDQDFKLESARIELADYFVRNADQYRSFSRGYGYELIVGTPLGEMSIYLDLEDAGDQIVIIANAILPLKIDHAQWPALNELADMLNATISNGEVLVWDGDWVAFHTELVFAGSLLPYTLSRFLCGIVVSTNWMLTALDRVACGMDSPSDVYAQLGDFVKTAGTVH